MVKIYENATHVILTGPETDLQVLSDAMKFRVPQFWMASSYKQFRATDGKKGWDGWTRPLKIIGGACKALRGHRDDLLGISELNGIDVDTTKLLPLPFRNIIMEDVRPDLVRAPFQLDQNQRKCIQQWLKHGIGINKVTVSGGKTALFGGAAALIKERFPNARFLYVTPSERLVRQATKELKKFLPHFDIGQYGGGCHDKDAKDMVVCTVAVLSRNFPDLVQDKWFKSFMAVLYDEVHHCASATSQKVLAEIPAYFRLGASDTIKEDDEAKFNTITGLFGPVRNTVTAAPLMEVGRIAKPHIYLVDIPEWRNKFEHVPFVATENTPAYALVDGAWEKIEYIGQVFVYDKNGKAVMQKKREYHEETDTWETYEVPVVEPGRHTVRINGEITEIESRWVLLNRLYDRGIIRFKERNKLIVDWARHFHKKKYPTVVVCTRTLHIYVLEALMQEVIKPKFVRILFSKDTSKQRDDTFEWLRSTPGGILITPLVKEGVSINEIRAGIVADYVADHEAANQIVGRFIRKKETDNRAQIVWFVDNQHPTYRRGCSAMFRKLEKIDGFKFYHPVAGPDSVTMQH